MLWLFVSIFCCNSCWLLLLFLIDSGCCACFVTFGFSSVCLNLIIGRLWLCYGMLIVFWFDYCVILWVFGGFSLLVWFVDVVICCLLFAWLPAYFTLLYAVCCCLLFVCCFVNGVGHKRFVLCIRLLVVLIWLFVNLLVVFSTVCGFRGLIVADSCVWIFDLLKFWICFVVCCNLLVGCN